MSIFISDIDIFYILILAELLFKSIMSFLNTSLGPLLFLATMSRDQAGDDYRKLNINNATGRCAGLAMIFTSRYV